MRSGRDPLLAWLLCKLSWGVRALQDYLTAPMPFLVGMCVTSLLGLDLEGVVVVDLDMASVSVGAAGYGIGKGHGTAELLPWAGCASYARWHPVDIRRLSWVWPPLWVCCRLAVLSECDVSSMSCGPQCSGLIRRLEEALALVYRTLRSPTELEATPLIAGLLQARPLGTRLQSGHMLAGLQLIA